MQYVSETGADIRVIYDGKELPYRIVFLQAGHPCHIVFAVPPGARRVDVYYGNAQATAPTREWEPSSGLLLETRRFVGGNVDTLGHMQETFAKCRPVLGADFVSKVFHGYNPFGPSTDFISAYTGWIKCPRTGDYEFATMAGGPTFMAIDKKQVCGRGWWGGPSGRARVRGRVMLTAGKHRFEYYVAHRWGRAAAVAAWLPPGDKTFDVIPASAFLDVPRGKLADYDVRNEPVAPDFSWENAADTQLSDGTVPVLMKFTDQTTAQASSGYEREWDFGDGVTSKDRSAQHIYLRSGPFTVTLRARFKGKEFWARQTVMVSQPWEKQVERKPGAVAKCAELVRDYPFDEMDAASLAAGLRLFAEAEQWPSFAKAARALLKGDKIGRLPEAAIPDTAILIGKVFRESVGDPDGAVQTLSRVEAMVTSSPRKAKVALEGADTRLYFMNDVEGARSAYERLVKKYALADKYVARQAHIRIGDTWAMQGKYDESLAAYRDAEAIKVSDMKRENFGVGARAFETEAFLRRGEYEAAREALSAWQWEHPVDKLVGEWSVLMGKWGLAAKDYGEAEKHLLRLRKVNPRSPYVPEALFLVADCCERRNRIPEAISALEALRKEYPESLLTEKAEARLAELARKVQRP